MTTNYTNFETIGTMTFEEATAYILNIEETREVEAEFNIQCETTTNTGLLIKDQDAYVYHFMNLRKATDFSDRFKFGGR